MTWRALPVLAFATIMVMACSQTMDYFSQNLSEGWAYEDPALFELEQSHEDVAGLDILIDHDPDYTYQNLYLKVDLTNQNTSYSDTISIQMADEKGYWISKCHNENCQLNYIYSFDEVQNIRSISIAQFSRDEILKGINQIGITLR